jgi:hypothetical protein
VATKRQQTQAKKARELAVKERRERKRARKAEAAAQRATGGPAAAESGRVPGAEGHAEIPVPELVR